MKTIWKFELKSGLNSLTMPADAQLLTVQAQGDCAMLWALIDPAQAVTLRSIYVVGTGREFDATRWHYIASFQFKDGALVFHAFAGEEN